MKILSFEIRNFRSIQTLKFDNLKEALILVGHNGVGKTSILEALCAVFGCYTIVPEDFHSSKANIDVAMELEFSNEDYLFLHHEKKVSLFKRYDMWFQEFQDRLPSLQENRLFFTFSTNYQGQIRYSDGYKKHNKYIPTILPRIYFLDERRDLEKLQKEILAVSESSMFQKMKTKSCIFDESKQCNYCFSCMGLINKKSPAELTALETEKLLEYKLYRLNLGGLSKKVTRQYRRNSNDSKKISFQMNIDPENLFCVTSSVTTPGVHAVQEPVSYLGKGMRSIYLLSLLEVCLSGKKYQPCLIFMEDPEMSLHPALQKKSSEILYRLSKKSQVIFTTHSPNLLFPFNEEQIRQVVLTKKGVPTVKSSTDIGAILNSLGQSAEDFLNVGFVFIVEGKQDKSRLPLLLNQYYKEVCDRTGKIKQIAILTTNSCTNIKTYANLKYMNQVYLKDHFLMIRDSDGKDRDKLSRDLCSYYADRGLEDVDTLPSVTQKNVLVLKYYSFENYFLNPKVMVEAGILSSEESFYEILFDRWKKYLYKTQSGRHLMEVLGRDFKDVNDIKEHLEEIKIYVRGHNLYDIFYGPFKKEEDAILKKYLSLAPEEDFKDIFDKIEAFSYFDNRRKS